MAIPGKGSIYVHEGALDILVYLTKTLQHHQRVLEEFNLKADIPWPLRERMRTIEGALGRVEIDHILDLIGRMGTEDAEDAIGKLWPDD